MKIIVIYGIVIIFLIGFLLGLLLTPMECDPIPFDPENPPWTRVPKHSPIPQYEMKFKQKYYIL